MADGDGRGITRRRLIGAGAGSLGGAALAGGGFALGKNEEQSHSSKPVPFDTFFGNVDAVWTTALSKPAIGCASVGGTAKSIDVPDAFFTSFASIATEIEIGQVGAPPSK